MGQSSLDVSEGANAVIFNPLFNARQIAELSNSEHDQLSLQGMSHFVESPSTLTNWGAYVHMFCSAFQFKTSNELLVGEVNEVVKHEEVTLCAGAVSTPVALHLSG